MTVTEYHDLLERVSCLPWREKTDLLAELAKQVRDVDRPNGKRCIRELRGLGKEIWEGIDVSEYIRQERASWDR